MPRSPKLPTFRRRKAGGNPQVASSEAETSEADAARLDRILERPPRAGAIKPEATQPDPE